MFELWWLSGEYLESVWRGFGAGWDNHLEPKNQAHQKILIVNPKTILSHMKNSNYQMFISIIVLRKPVAR